MDEYLPRFAKPLQRERLAKTLTGERPATEPLPTKIKAEKLRAALSDLDPSATGAKIEEALVEPFHKAFEGLTRREAADMRLWHYVAVIEGPDIIWRRWNRGVVPPPGCRLDAHRSDQHPVSGQGKSQRRQPEHLRPALVDGGGAPRATTTTLPAWPFETRTRSKPSLSGSLGSTPRPLERACASSTASPKMTVAGPRRGCSSACLRPF